MNSNYHATAFILSNLMHMKTMAWLLAVIIGASLDGTAWGEGMEFPSARPSLSPQKRFEITSTNDAQNKDAFMLRLKNRNSGEQTEIFHGSRSCDVLWSDDDSSVAITDWSAGNQSGVLVLKTSQKVAATALKVDMARHTLFS